MKRKKKHGFTKFDEAFHHNNHQCNNFVNGARNAMIILFIIVTIVPSISCAPQCQAAFEQCTQIHGRKLRINPSATLPGADNMMLGSGLRALMPSELQTKSIGRPPPRSSSRSSAETAELCTSLTEYDECLRPVVKSCKTDLQFSSTRTLIRKLKQLEGCPEGRQKNMLAGGQFSLQGSQARGSSDLSNGMHSTSLSASLGGFSTLLTNQEEEDDSSDEETKERLAKCKAATGFHDQSDNKPRTIPGIPGIEQVPVTSTADRSPPLICLAYGDPHLRTFSHDYQTCKCSGAWPLVDHPLFAVQITNSPLSRSNPQVTGITKVTVLVRQLPDCNIHNDFIYEADTTMTTSGESGISSFSLPSTFTNGQRASMDEHLKITKTDAATSTHVVTIHLNHVGARIYIGHSLSSNYLSVIIKFATASTDKQKQHLAAMNDYSICKSGCPMREQIEVKEILTAASINYEWASYVDEHKTQQDIARETAIIAAGGSLLNIDTSESESDEQGPQQAVISHSNTVIDTDPCQGLYGYYRVSCLYDVTIKGLKDANNACRFAQSFDHIDAIRMSLEKKKTTLLKNSSQFVNDQRTTRESSSLSQPVSSTMTITSRLSFLIACVMLSYFLP